MLKNFSTYVKYIKIKSYQTDGQRLSDGLKRLKVHTSVRLTQRHTNVNYLYIIYINNIYDLYI